MAASSCFNKKLLSYRETYQLDYNSQQAQEKNHMTSFVTKVILRTKLAEIFWWVTTLVFISKCFIELVCQMFVKTHCQIKNVFIKYSASKMVGRFEEVLELIVVGFWFFCLFSFVLLYWKYVCNSKEWVSSALTECFEQTSEILRTFAKSVIRCRVGATSLCTWSHFTRFNLAIFTCLYENNSANTGTISCSDTAYIRGVLTCIILLTWKNYF